MEDNSLSRKLSTPKKRIDKRHIVERLKLAENAISVMIGRSEYSARFYSRSSSNTVVGRYNEGRIVIFKSGIVIYTPRDVLENGDSDTYPCPTCGGIGYM